MSNSHPFSAIPANEIGPEIGRSVNDPIVDVAIFRDVRSMDIKQPQDRYLPPGTPVRYNGTTDEHNEDDRPEFGVVIHCWKNDEISGMHDCYVAFFGDELPDGQPEEQPYILRYAAVSLEPIATN